MSRQLFPLFETSVRSGSLPLYRDVAMDFDAGVPVFSGGQPVWVSGLEAVRGWAWRAVATARYRYSCFSWDYGCELERLVGQPYGNETRRSEAVRYVREALEVCPYITSVQAAVEGLEGPKLKITVRMETVYGGTEFYV